MQAGIQTLTLTRLSLLLLLYLPSTLISTITLAWPLFVSGTTSAQRLSWPIGP